MRVFDCLHHGNQQTDVRTQLGAGCFQMRRKVAALD